MNVRNNIIFNALAQVGNRIVRICDQLLLVPFFLTMWGASYYGEWLTISIIPSVLAFSDLGFGTAVSNNFVLAYTSGDKQRASNTYITGILTITITILLGILLSFIVIFSAWKGNLLSKSEIDPGEIIVSLIFLMGSRLICFYSQLFEGFFRAKQKAALAFNLYTIDGILKICFGLISLLSGYKIVGYSIFQFVESLIFNVFYAFWAIHIVKDLPKGHAVLNIAIATLKNGFGFMLTPIWQSLYMQGSTFAVRLILGPSAVAIFNTVRTVCKSVNAIFATVNGAIFPEIQIAFGKGDKNTIKRIYIFAMQFVFIAGVLGTVFLMFFGQQLYSLWTHNVLELSTSVWLIFMVGIPLNALWWTAGTIFRAINQPLKFSMFGFISALISTISSYVLAIIFGLDGAAIGYVIMDIVMLFLIMPLSCKVIDIQMRDIFNLKKTKYEFAGFFKKKRY